MKNLFINKEYESTDRVNTLPFRSHYIPYGLNQDFEYIHGVIDKTKSNKFISLNGMWEFKPHTKLSNDIDLNELLIEEIEVPSCVQMKGYDYIQYTNIVFPFPFNPPFIDIDNPVFHYRKTVDLGTLKDNYYLNFEGVDSAFYLYVNGRYVGYSQITHSTSEFDVSSFLQEGKNVIDVLVLKWCASSYLEDQDKFRFSGIIRDVYILNRKKEHITDYKVEPIYKDKKWYIYFKNLSNVNLSLELLSTSYLIGEFDDIYIEIKNPILWSSDNPYLYDVILKAGDEKILQKVGLRYTEIKDGIFQINGKHIKLKGVNRHESHPDKGSSVSIENTYKDLVLIKSINANAIRTSHYPDIPEFYELCNVLGLYVLDEADVESHGAAETGSNFQAWQEFADNGIYDNAVLDRETSLYERDKNFTCVIMWSIGNESNYGKMFYQGIDYIKSRDRRYIHYEGLYNLVDRSEYYTDRVDIISYMYPTMDMLKINYLKDEQEKRPLLICEYTHAMGNSCGDVRDYWEIINSTPRIIGAFVWEWCDHAVNIGGKLLYGSDFPKHRNDGNFCVDGLVTPYREFKSSTEEIKAIYSGKYYPDKIKGGCSKINKKPAKTELNFKFSEDLPIIEQISIGDKEYLKEPLKLNFFRANLDNDLMYWESIARYSKTHLVSKKTSINNSVHQYECDLVDADNKSLINLNISFIPKKDGLVISYAYRMLSDDRPFRIGFEFVVDKLDKFKFKGYGPGESYIDKCVHNSYGIHTYNIKDNLDNYLKPQESGSRYGVQYVKTNLFDVVAEKTFSFNMQHVSINQLMNTKHNYELVDENKTYVYIDLHMAGVGSCACGPKLADKYLPPKEDSNVFYIKFKR